MIQYDSKFDLGYGGCDEEDCEIRKNENACVIREVPMLTRIATRVIYLIILPAMVTTALSPAMLT